MIDCVAAARGEVLCGPFYQPLGVFGDLPPTEEEFNNVVEGHRAAMAYVGDSAIKLAIEPLNRFECNLVNTVERAAELVGAVDRPGYGILYDTFHLNIEEKRPVDAINSAIGAINHVHISGNDRGLSRRAVFERRLARVEPQIALLLLAVTAEAIFAEDRQHFFMKALSLRRHAAGRGGDGLLDFR